MMRDLIRILRMLIIVYWRIRIVMGWVMMVLLTLYRKFHHWLSRKVVSRLNC
jgi:hypothetical protein